MSSKDLFQQVVAELGMSMILGPGVVKRALSSVGANHVTASPKSYRACLDELELRLGNYIGKESARERIAAVRKLLDEYAAANPA